MNFAFLVVAAALASDPALAHSPSTDGCAPQGPGAIILDGPAGQTIAGDLPCSDRAAAFRVYREALIGPLGRRHEWRNSNGEYGYFIAIREFRDHGQLCREFNELTYRHARWHERGGTACKAPDDNWHVS